MRPIEHDRYRTALFNFLADGLQDHNGDMFRTITWANNKLWKINSGHVRDEDYYLATAFRILTADEKNQIIHELTMGGVVNGTQH